MDVFKAKLTDKVAGTEIEAHAMAGINGCPPVEEFKVMSLVITNS